VRAVHSGPSKAVWKRCQRGVPGHVAPVQPSNHGASTPGAGLTADECTDLPGGHPQPCWTRCRGAGV